jgi:hypothetical protein
MNQSENPNVAAMTPDQDWLRRMEIEQKEDEVRRRAVPLHVNITEANGGWIVGSHEGFGQQQTIVTSMGDLLAVVCKKLTREV